MSDPKEASNKLPVVLVVDDDDAYRNRLCRAFRDRGCEAHEVSRPEDTLELARSVSRYRVGWRGSWLLLSLCRWRGRIHAQG